MTRWGTINPVLVVSTAQFNKTTDTALATVTGLSLNLAASTKYKLEANLFIDTTLAGGHKYALDGTVTVTGIKYQVESINVDNAQLVLSARLTALAGTAGQSGAGTTFYTEIKGIIASSAAGTINVRFAQENASGTSS